MNKLSERFERKIPTFLAHLDVWNDTPMSDCKYTTHDYNREMHKQNYIKKMCDLRENIHLYELQQTPIMLQQIMWQ